MRLENALFAVGRKIRLNPALKLLSVMTMLITISACRDLSFGVSCFALPVILLWLALERPSIYNLLKRIAVILPFIGVIAFFGLNKALGGPGSMVNRGILSGVFLVLLTGTTPFYEILNALRRLRVPGVMILILSFTYRYLDLIIKEGKRLERARNLRFFGSGYRRQAEVLGNMIGSLFVRSYDRADRVYSAMLLRGYSKDAPDLAADYLTSEQYTLSPMSINILYALIFAISTLAIGVSTIWHF